MGFHVSLALGCTSSPPAAYAPASSSEQSTTIVSCRSNQCDHLLPRCTSLGTAPPRPHGASLVITLGCVSKCCVLRCTHEGAPLMHPPSVVRHKLLDFLRRFAGAERPDYDRMRFGALTSTFHAPACGRSFSLAQQTVHTQQIQAFLPQPNSKQDCLPLPMYRRGAQHRRLASPCARQTRGCLPPPA